MGTGYTRNDTANNIADGNVINASDLDGEFDAVQAAFNGTTGHSHDGTSGEGPQIDTAGIAADAIDGTKIADDSIDSEHYVDGSIDTAHIANDAVTGDKLANNIQIAGTLGVTGETTLTTHLNMGDNDIIKLGASADLQLFHDGSNSYVKDVGTGSLILTSDGVGVNIQKGTTEIMAQFVADGANIFKYDNSTKLQTTATGATVTGELVADTVDATTLQIGNTSITATAAELNYNDITALGQVQAFKTVTADGNGWVNFGDNEKIRFGASNDLEIYHDSLHSYIKDTGTGNLRIPAANFNVRSANDLDSQITAVSGAGVSLYYNASKKFETLTGGVDITGNITVSGTVDGRDVATDGTKLDGIESGATADQTASEILTLIKTVDGAGSGLDADTLDGVTSGSFLRSDAEDTKTAGALNFSDNVAARFGASNDLQIFHDGVNSYISEGGTGNLRIRGGNLFLEEPGGGNFIGMTDGGTGGTVTLYHNASAKLATKSDGVDITGELQSDSLDVDGNADISGQLTMGGNVNLQDNDKLQLGASQDLQIYHNGTASYIEDVGTGNLIIRGTDINIQDREGNNFIFCDDTGTGGTIYLYHNNSSKLNTQSSGINIDGSINAVDNIYLASAIYHEGDTDTYTQFHAANQWRVVTGGTEMLEVNDSYVLLGANSVGNVQTTNVASAITPNMHVYNSFVLTLTGNITLGSPTTEVAGMSGVFVFIHSGAGRTVSVGAEYETVGGAGLTLSGTSGAVDIVPYYVRSSGNIILGTPQLAVS